MNVKILGILIFSALIFSCNNPQKVEEDDEAEAIAEGLFKGIKQGDFEIVVIQNCEYLVYTEDFGSTQQGYGFMAHMGNCNNPIHACPQPNEIDIDSVANRQ